MKNCFLSLTLFLFAVTLLGMSEQERISTAKRHMVAVINSDLLRTLAPAPDDWLNKIELLETGPGEKEFSFQLTMGAFPYSTLELEIATSEKPDGTIEFEWRE